MKALFYSILLNIIFSQNLWYKNLICAGGWYAPDELQTHPDTFSIESDFYPIRIYIDFIFFNTQCESDDKAYKDICSIKDKVKHQLTKASKLIEKIINIKRFSQNLYFPDDLLMNVIGSENYTHILNEGIPYDYVILLKIEKNTRVNYGNKILGFQSDPMIFEQSTKRPIFGITYIFNNDYTHMENTDYFLLNSFIHQIIHLLVFHPKLIKNFPISTNAYIDAKDYTGYRNFRYISTPKVVEYGKRHFSDDNFFGVPLDFNSNLDNGMVHWHERFMLGDIMIPDLYQEQTLSEMTLALFEDSTWYKVNYYTGGLFRFGKGESNYFLRNKCINDLGPLYEFPNDFCEKENQKRCTPGHMSKGYCKFYTDSVSSPFQYWPNNRTKGGIRGTDYCPIAEREDYNPNLMYNFYPGSCKNGLVYREGLVEVMSGNSFCVVSTVFPLGTDLYIYGVEQRGACYPMYCTDSSLTVQIGNYYIVCKKNGGIMHMPENLGYMGGFECPHYNTICTGTVVCNDIEECINKKSEPRESSYIYEGFSQEYQSLFRDDIPPDTPNVGEGSENGKCGKNCIYCKEGNSCLKCRDGEYSIGSKFNDRNDNNYLYCDLTSNFTEDLYEKYNDIYYPKNIPTVELTYEKAYGLKFIMLFAL